MRSLSEENSWTIGADPTCDIWLNHPNVSGVHCRLTKTNGRYQLQDLQSSNGTFVNSRKIDSAVVSPFDKILLANTVEMPWPEEALAKQVISMGSGEGNEVQLEHRSVSARHAKLILDRNDQCLIRDLESTNGTWVGKQSIGIVVLEPDTPFRVGAVEVTPTQVLQRAREGRPNGGVHVGFLAAGGLASVGLVGLLLTAIFLVAMRPDAESKPVVERSPVAVEVDRVGEAGGEVKTVDAPSAALVNVQKLTDVDDSPELTPWQRAEKSLFLILVNHDGTKMDFTTAWAISPTRLITTANAVESIRRHRFPVSAVHLSSGNEVEFATMGQHPSYGVYLQKLLELTYRVNERTAALGGDNAGSLSKVDAQRQLSELREWKMELPFIQQAVDTFDAGYIDLAASVDEATPIRIDNVDKRPIQKRQVLQLQSSLIQADAAFYDPEAVRDPISFRLRINAMIPPSNEHIPLRWTCLFEPDSSISGAHRHADYLAHGCPIFDLNGRLAGLCRGPKRSLNELGVSENEQALVADEIEMVPVSVLRVLSDPQSSEVKK